MVVTGLENYTVTYMYDINNRLTREEQVDTHGVVSAFVFTYDRNGNQRTRAEVGAMGLETRVYNAFNQLVQFSDSAGGVVSSYSYRADGLRHTVMVNGIRMYHVWLRNHIVLERNGRREVTELYVRGAGGRLLRSHNHLWFVYNNRGDVVQRVDNIGQVLHTYRFGAFGVELNPDPSNSNRFRFAGEYHDLHRGNEVFLRARIYNARLGRFTSPDPHWSIHAGNMIFGDSPTMRNDRYMPNIHAILQAGNLYMFTLHNPVRWVDPTGLFAIPWWDDFIEILTDALRAVGDNRRENPCIVQSRMQATRDSAWESHHLPHGMQMAAMFGHQPGTSDFYEAAHRYALFSQWSMDAVIMGVGGIRIVGSKTVSSLAGSSIRAGVFCKIEM